MPSDHRAREVADFVPLCVPEIRGSEWAYVKECLDTGWVSSVGPFVERFEREFAACVGTRHAVATVNGTAALHVALLVAGVQPGDEVLVSTLTFIAPVNTVRYAGAWPVLVDAEPQHWVMDVQRAVEFLDRECRWSRGELRDKSTGRRVGAILPVHILGHPVDMDPLVEVARKYRLAVIEDATESLGARYKGRNVGTLGDVACFSFNGNKTITTGGGGMLVTDNSAVAERAKYLTTQARDSVSEYIHNAIGFNYRLSNIQAAIGVAQLERLNEYLSAKREHADVYARELRGTPGVTLPREAPWAFHAFWLYTVLVDQADYAAGARDLIACLKGHNIEARPLWMPMHATVVHRGARRTVGRVADRLYEQAISLPSSVGLTKEAQERVIRVIKEGRNG